jgi:hypothetical protein
MVQYPLDRIDVRGEVVRALFEQGVAAELMPLETMHKRVRAEDKLPVQGLIGAPTILSDSRLRTAYQALIKYLAREVLQFDVVFETNPPIRFHFPGRMPDRFRSPSGALLTHHSDLLGGDPFDQINGWLPLTDCRGTSTLQIVSFSQSQHMLARFADRIEFDAARFAQSRIAFYETICEDQAFEAELLQSSQPLDIDYGKVALFDGRLIHATAENMEDITRVSIDFRLLPIEGYEALARHWTIGEQLSSARWRDPLKGGFYDDRSAYEL